MLSTIRQWKNLCLLLLFHPHLLKPTAFQTLVVLSTMAGSTLPMQHKEWQRSSKTMFGLRLVLIFKIELGKIRASHSERDHLLFSLALSQFCELDVWKLELWLSLRDQAFQWHILYRTWYSVAFGSSYFPQCPLSSPSFLSTPNIISEFQNHIRC